MHRREIVSLTALALTALTVGVGCPEEQKPPPPKPVATNTAGATTGTPAVTKTAAAPAAAMGNGTIKGVVNFTGKALEMKVPTKRKETDVCKDKEVPFNAVLVKDGKLQDVLVRIENGGVKGDFKAPDKHAVIDQHECMYTPRIQGVVSGQEIDIKNSDATLHNVHTYKGVESWFNQAQPKGAEPMSKELEGGVIKFKCDVHPWMTGFVVVTDHPFFAVSGADGAFSIEKVPAGKYKVEAWHSHYGAKTAEVEVADGKAGEVTFSYDGTEAEPPENKDELKGLW
jgi:plastocyanin